MRLFGGQERGFAQKVEVRRQPFVAVEVSASEALSVGKDVRRAVQCRHVFRGGRVEIDFIRHQRRPASPIRAEADARRREGTKCIQGDGEDRLLYGDRCINNNGLECPIHVCLNCNSVRQHRRLFS